MKNFPRKIPCYPYDVIYTYRAGILPIKKTVQPEAGMLYRKNDTEEVGHLR